MAVPAPAFIPPADRPAASPDAVEPEPVRMVGDHKVINVGPLLSPLSKPGKPVYFRGITIVTLDDHTQVHGCADCSVTGNRGDIMRHRVSEHGAAKSPGPGRPPREEPPVNLMALPVGELLELAHFGASWEPVVTMQLVQIDELTERASTAERELAKIRRAMAKIGFVVKVDED